MSTEIQEYSPSEAALIELRGKYAAAVFDVTTGKGMAAAKEARADVRGYRIALEKKRVEIKQPALDRCRAIDTEAKRLTAELLALEEPIDSQIRAEERRKAAEKEAAERAERERIAAINARFDAIRALPARTMGSTADGMRAILAEAEGIDPASFPDDLAAAAKHERLMAISAIRAALDARIQSDDQAAELAKLREQAAAVDAERKRLESVAREQELAAERAKAQAEAEERRRVEDLARAEREKSEAAERAKAQQERERIAAEKAEADKAEAVRQAEAKAAQQAAELELARLAEIARAKAEDEKRAADKAHRQAVHDDIVSDLMIAGITLDVAALLVDLIDSGKVAHVSITY